MGFLKELWAFLRVRKKLWLAPIIFVMVILGGLLVLAHRISTRLMPDFSNNTECSSASL